MVGFALYPTLDRSSPVSPSGPRSNAPARSPSNLDLWARGADIDAPTERNGCLRLVPYPPSDGPLPHLRTRGEGTSSFGNIFFIFPHFELGVRGYTQAQGAAFSCLRLKLADVVLI